MARVTALALALLLMAAAPACSRQEAAWRAASGQDTPAAYERYLRDFPAGAHAVAARTRLHALREDEAWLRAVRSGHPEAYQRYLAEYADGRHAPEAQAQLAAFLDDESRAARPADGSLPPGETVGSGVVGDAAAYRLQLGAFGTERGAGEAWQALGARHRDLLEGLDARIDAVDERGRTLWRLRAGPVTPPRARELCGALAARGESCLALGGPSVP